MEKSKIIFILLIIALVGLGIYLIYYFHSANYECISNPQAYSIKTLEKANNDTISCSCSAIGQNPKIFSIDDKGIHLNIPI